MEDPGVRLESTGERLTGSRDETTWAPLTTEFWAMVVLIAAVLIAAAVSDSLNDVRAWTLVTVIGAAYILGPRRGVSYRYRIRAVNRDGTASWFGPVLRT